VQKGRSLLVWRDYFAKGAIVGLDKRDRPKRLTDDIAFIKGNQADPAALAEASGYGPFDIIIDDASHIGALTRATFLGLFPSLKPGGLYVVEDYGTSFREGWPDFVASTPNRENLESCCTGMVGFLKQLVDDLVSDHPERQPVASASAIGPKPSSDI
jgi:demethylmacrocin O-methyltransferase